MNQPPAAGDSPVLSFHLTDADEAVAVGSELFYDHSMTPLSNRPFVFDLNAGRVGSVTVGELTYASPVAIEVGAQDDAYGISFLSNGALELGVGQHEYAATSSHAALIGPVDKVRIRGWHEGDERLTMLRFDRQTLEAELGRHLGIEITTKIPFSVELDIRRGRGAEWAHFARMITDSLGDPNAIVWNPLIAARLSSAVMTGLFLSTEHPYREALEAPPKRTTPPMIHRAARYIEEHAHEPLTIPEIAAAVGASARTLQRGFAEHLKTTPGRYLIRVRMDRAHSALVAGSPETTSVARIATAWGFHHHSRFSATYRALYGASPSVTLRS